MPVIPAQGRRKLEHLCKCEASLGYKASSRQAWATKGEPVSKGCEGGDVAQVVEYLACTKACFNPQHHMKQDMVSHACNLSTPEVKAGGLERLRVILGYMVSPRAT